MTSVPPVLVIPATAPGVHLSGNIAISVDLPSQAIYWLARAFIYITLMLSIGDSKR